MPKIMKVPQQGREALSLYRYVDRMLQNALSDFKMGEKGAAKRFYADALKKVQDNPAIFASIDFKLRSFRGVSADYLTQKLKALKQYIPKKKSAAKALAKQVAVATVLYRAKGASSSEPALAGYASRAPKRTSTAPAAPAASKAARRNVVPLDPTACCKQLVESGDVHKLAEYLASLPDEQVEWLEAKEWATNRHLAQQRRQLQTVYDRYLRAQQRSTAAHGDAMPTVDPIFIHIQRQQLESQRRRDEIAQLEQQVAAFIGATTPSAGHPHAQAASSTMHDAAREPFDGMVSATSRPQLAHTPYLASRSSSHLLNRRAQPGQPAVPKSAHGAGVPNLGMPRGQ
jgi:hypothetical protein